MGFYMLKDQNLLNILIQEIKIIFFLNYYLN